MRLQHFMDEQKAAYNSRHGCTLRSVGNPGVRVSCGVKSEKVSVLSEDHTPFALSPLNMSHV